MSTKLASDDVYSETSRWTMTSWGLGGVPEAWIRIQKGMENITIANGCLLQLHYNT